MADIYGDFPQGFPTLEDIDPQYSRRVFLNTPVKTTNHEQEVKHLSEGVITKISMFGDN